MSSLLENDNLIYTVPLKNTAWSTVEKALHASLTEWEAMANTLSIGQKVDCSQAVTVTEYLQARCTKDITAFFVDKEDDLYGAQVKPNRNYCFLCRSNTTQTVLCDQCGAPIGCVNCTVDTSCNDVVTCNLAKSNIESIISKLKPYHPYSI